MYMKLSAITQKQKETATTVLRFLAIGLVSALVAWPLGWAIVRYGVIYPFAAIAAIGIAFSIFRSPWVGVLMLTFFLPFERIGSVDIAGSTVRVSQVVLACLIGSLFLSIAKNKKQWKMPTYPIAIPLFIYIIAAITGFLVTPNMSRSISVFLFVVFTMTASLVVPIMVNTQEKLVRVLQVLGAALLIVGAFGVYQFVGDWIGLPNSLTGLRALYSKDVLGFPRVQSTALEPLYYANYLLLPLSVLASLFLARQSKVFAQWQVIGLLGLGLLNLVLTVARGGYIAFAASVCVLLAYYFFTMRLLTPRNLSYAFAIVGVVVIAATQFLQIGAVADKAITHVTDLFAGASYNERVETFEIATQAFQQYPLFGIGVGSFGPYASWNPMVEPETGWAIVNNEYLEVLAETGIVGFIGLMSAFFIVIIRSLYALKKSENTMVNTILIGALAAFIGILVQYNTFSILYIMHVWFVVGLLIALQNIALHNTKQDS